MSPRRLALLLLCLLCSLQQCNSKYFGFGGRSLAKVKLPKSRNIARRAKVQGARVSRIEVGEKKKAEPSYKPSPSFSSQGLVKRLLDPGSLLFHISPSVSMLLLSRFLGRFNFSSTLARDFTRGVAFLYFLFSHGLLWQVRRIIKAKADNSLVDDSPQSIMDLLGALGGAGADPSGGARTVLAYDLAEVDRLQSSLSIEASLCALMLTMSYYKQLLLYLSSNALSLLRANVMLVHLFGMYDEQRYPYLRRPFKSSVQALLSTYLGKYSQANSIGDTLSVLSKLGVGLTVPPASVPTEEAANDIFEDEIEDELESGSVDAEVDLSSDPAEGVDLQGSNGEGAEASPPMLAGGLSRSVLAEKISIELEKAAADLLSDTQDLDTD